MDTVVDTAVETAERIGKGWLNGTTRAQAYGILTLTAGLGAAAGSAATAIFVKRNFNLTKKYKKVPVATVEVQVPTTPETDEPVIR